MRITGYILASDSESIEESVQAEFINKFKPVFRADPGKELPVISQQTPDHLVRMHWGMDQRIKPGFFQYFTDSYGIIKKPFFRVLIRKSRCLVPANGMLVRLKNKLYFLFSKRDKILTFAGIYHAWKESDTGKTTTGFSILTQKIFRENDGSSIELPILITKNRKRAFLKDVKPMMDIVPMLKKEYKDHFKMYEVRSDLYNLISPIRDDIMPLNQKIISSEKEYKTINTKRYYY